VTKTQNTHTKESTHSDISPVWQTPIQKTVKPHTGSRTYRIWRRISGVSFRSVWRGFISGQTDWLQTSDFRLQQILC